MSRRQRRDFRRLVLALALLGAGARAWSFNCYVALQDPGTGHRVLLLGEEHDDAHLDDDWKRLFAEIDQVRSAKHDSGRPVESNLHFEWHPWHASKTEALPEWAVPEDLPGTFRCEILWGDANSLHTILAFRRMHRLD